tara:strand:- start:1164 stop:1652 length:489 start_codon:yes stop_codon:yes gene_type:complete
MGKSYDEIKKLLGKSRDMKNDLIREEEGRELTSQEQSSEESDFKRAVSDRVKFGKIRIYDSGDGLPKVEWMGELVRERMEFVFSLDDTIGCYVSADLLQLRDETLKTLEKMRAYYDTWAKKWSEEIPVEFGDGEDDFEGDDIGFEFEPGDDIEDEGDMEGEL